MEKSDDTPQRRQSHYPTIDMADLHGNGGDPIRYQEVLENIQSALHQGCGLAVVIANGRPSFALCSNVYLNHFIDRTLRKGRAVKVEYRDFESFAHEVTVLAYEIVLKNHFVAVSHDDYSGLKPLCVASPLSNMKEIYSSVSLPKSQQIETAIAVRDRRNKRLTLKRAYQERCGMNIAYGWHKLFNQFPKGGHYYRGKRGFEVEIFKPEFDNSRDTPDTAEEKKVVANWISRAYRRDGAEPS